MRFKLFYGRMPGSGKQDLFIHRKSARRKGDLAIRAIDSGKSARLSNSRIISLAHELISTAVIPRKQESRVFSYSDF